MFIGGLSWETTGARRGTAGRGPTKQPAGAGLAGRAHARSRSAAPLSRPLRPCSRSAAAAAAGAGRAVLLARGRPRRPGARRAAGHCPPASQAHAAPSLCTPQPALDSPSSLPPGAPGADQKLRAYFENYGTVQEAFVSYDKHTGRPRGFGFVVFADPIIADKVRGGVAGSDREALPGLHVLFL